MTPSIPITRTTSAKILALKNLWNASRCCSTDYTSVEWRTTAELDGPRAMYSADRTDIVTFEADDDTLRNEMSPSPSSSESPLLPRSTTTSETDRCCCDPESGTTTVARWNQWWAPRYRCGSGRRRCAQQILALIAKTSRKNRTVKVINSTSITSLSTLTYSECSCSLQLSLNLKWTL